MFEKLELTRMAQSLAAHAGARLSLVAQNVAHADTPGYRARDLPAFADVYDSAGTTLRATHPGHMGGQSSAADARPMDAGGWADPNGNSVSLETEMIRATEVRQAHDMALAVYRNTSGIIRAALGRGGQ